MIKNEKMKNRIGLSTIWWKTHLKYGKFYNNKFKFTLTDPMSDVFIFFKKIVEKRGGRKQYRFKEKSRNREVFNQNASKNTCFGKPHEF